jgi:nitrite reductase/ring-hydroxylating ferredoxin subunit/uncharacterized membrane protein
MTTKEPKLMTVTETVTENVPAIKATAITIRQAIHNAVLAGGEPTRKLSDLLHGTWLGHPLHPVLTDVTIGAWTFGTLFDLMSLLRRSPKTEDAADTLIALGAASAIPTAMAGLNDYSTIKKGAAEYGMIHGLMNTLGLILYVSSLRARQTNNRGLAVMLSALGFGGMMFSAWLGGELVYRFRIGVNHGKDTGKPEQWTPVMSEMALAESAPIRVDIQGQPVLLYRKEGTIYAIGAVCSHAGGPLEDGKFYGECVECPWHNSVYDLRDGSVVHGPTTYAQPNYQVRITNGEIEIRAEH